MIREYEEADRAGVMAIETAYETDAIFDVVVDPRRIDLVPKKLAAPRVKRYAIADAFAAWAKWEKAWVADAGGIVGFAAVEYVPWHVRLILWHLYVSPAQRGRGIARALMARVEDHGRACGASHVWLETSNVNPPGIAAYERLGYALCGADVLFYEDTPYDDERALYFAKRL